MRSATDAPPGGLSYNGPMTEPAPAGGDDRDGPRPVAPIPLPPDPLAPWLGAPSGADLFVQLHFWN